MTSSTVLRFELPGTTLEQLGLARMRRDLQRSRFYIGTLLLLVHLSSAEETEENWNVTSLGSCVVVKLYQNRQSKHSVSRRDDEMHQEHSNHSVHSPSSNMFHSHFATITLLSECYNLPMTRGHSRPINVFLRELQKGGI